MTGDEAALWAIVHPTFRAALREQIKAEIAARIEREEFVEMVAAMHREMIAAMHREMMVRLRGATSVAIPVTDPEHAGEHE